MCRVSSHHMDFDGKTALVTGASRNIGQAIATELAELGADVGVSAKSNREGCLETAARIEDAGGEAAVALADLTEPSEIETMVAEIREELGPIDVLVNNATYRPEKPFLEVELEELDEVQNINFRGLFLTTQAALPLLRRSPRARIVNIGGLSGHKGARGRAHVVTLKAAVAGFTRALASEFDQPGMTVNTVVPGSIETLRTGPDPGHLRDTGGRRFGRPEEVAFIVAKLCEDGAGYVNGQTIHVNGGSHL